MDISSLKLEELIGGIVAILVAIYGVHKKFKSDKVEDSNQKAEINIIDHLIKQRDDAVGLSEKYLTLFQNVDLENRELRAKLESLEAEKDKLIEAISKSEIDADMLRTIIKYLTDTLSIARESLEQNKNDSESNKNDE